MVAMVKPMAANGPFAEQPVLAGKGLKPQVGFQAGRKARHVTKDGWLADSHLPYDFFNPHKVSGEGNIKLGVVRTLTVTKRFSAYELDPVSLGLYRAWEVRCIGVQVGLVASQSQPVGMFGALRSDK
ncbi:MAG: hypothetical protein E6Q63_02865 [Novosphingobium sp.]|nr:MAG: hypothetical protein E6Q63_02865 [Novosphingobium sp.]